MKFLKAHPSSKPKDGPVSRYLNRWLSAPVSTFLLKTKITPNQVTIAISLLTVPMLVAGIYGYIIVVGLILQLASVLDGVDGEIARSKHLKSEFGALLDTTLDYWIDSIGIMSLGLALIEEDMLSAPLTLSLVTFTVAVRLISQFVVKTAPYTKAHIVGDTRDVVTFLIFIGATLTELLGSWCIVVTLLLVNIWRLDNMVYRILTFWRFTRAPVESKTLPLGLPGIPSGMVSQPPSQEISIFPESSELLDNNHSLR